MKISGIKLKKTGRIRLSTIAETIIVPEPTGPQWTMSSNLGTFEENTDVVIPLLYTDPDNVVSGMSLTGSLPFGIQFNALEKEISGVITASETTRYDFTLSLLTPDGPVSKDFYFTAQIPERGVAWATDSNLGSYDGGQGVDIGLKAESKS